MAILDAVNASYMGRIVRQVKNIQILKNCGQNEGYHEEAISIGGTAKSRR
jgi:hypothetical protein